MEDYVLYAVGVGGLRGLEQTGTRRFSSLGQKEMLHWTWYGNMHTERVQREWMTDFPLQSRRVGFIQKVNQSPNPTIHQEAPNLPTLRMRLVCSCPTDQSHHQQSNSMDQPTHLPAR